MNESARRVLAATRKVRAFEAEAGSPPERLEALDRFAEAVETQILLEDRRSRGDVDRETWVRAVRTAGAAGLDIGLPLPPEVDPVEFFENPDLVRPFEAEDPLAPARGCVFGIVFGLAIFAIVGALLYWLVAR